MTRNTADRTDDGREEGRYAVIEVEGGSIVIYDRDLQTAWLQSDGAVPLDAAT